jgi:uncharacterized OB-fold protein
MRLIDETLFAEPAFEQPVLAGSRCAECGTTTFPRQVRCPRCGGGGMGETRLPTEGTIWSATVQHFPPKTPFRYDGQFEPFGLGYVDLDEVLVEARFTVNAIGELAIGRPVRLTLVPAFTDDDGTQVVTYAFEPITTEGTS